MEVTGVDVNAGVAVYLSRMLDFPTLKLYRTIKTCTILFDYLYK